MKWSTYPLKFVQLWRLGKWLIAKAIYERNGKTTAILSRNDFGNLIPDYVPEYHDDITKIRFKLITFPFEIVDQYRIVRLKFSKVSIEWSEKLVRLDDGKVIEHER